MLVKQTPKSEDDIVPEIPEVPEVPGHQVLHNLKPFSIIEFGWPMSIGPYVNKMHLAEYLVPLLYL
jgi:hypothetical protein